MSGILIVVLVLSMLFMHTKYKQKNNNKKSVHTSTGNTISLGC